MLRCHHEGTKLQKEDSLVSNIAVHTPSGTEPSVQDHPSHRSLSSPVGRTGRSQLSTAFADQLQN